jgi:hypothetical protein
MVIKFVGDMILGKQSTKEQATQRASIGESKTAAITSVT